MPRPVPANGATPAAVTVLICATRAESVVPAEGTLPSFDSRTSLPDSELFLMSLPPRLLFLTSQTVRLFLTFLPVMVTAA